MVTIDTTNVPFICGGRFDGIEHLLERRVGCHAVGFLGSISAKGRGAREILKHFRPGSSFDYRLIPKLQVARRNSSLIEQHPVEPIR